MSETEKKAEVWNHVKRLMTLGLLFQATANPVMDKAAVELMTRKTEPASPPKGE